MDRTIRVTVKGRLSINPDVTRLNLSLEGLSVEASVKHLAKFASDIWQVLPFGEGNTRATLVIVVLTSTGNFSLSL